MYTEHPKEIKVNRFYFVRHKNNLRPRVFHALKVHNDDVIGIVNFKKEERVKKSELLRFDVSSRLFRFMMRMSTFRNDTNIRKALQKMKMDEYKRHGRDGESREVYGGSRDRESGGAGKKEHAGDKDGESSRDERSRDEDEEGNSTSAAGRNHSNTNLNGNHYPTGKNNEMVKSSRKTIECMNNTEIDSFLLSKDINCFLKSERRINTFDRDMTEQEFEKAYKEYVLMDDKFIPDSEKNSANIIVPGTKEINMYSLYRIVSENGGMENVTNEQKWKSLFYGAMRKTNVSYTVRTFYKKFLYEFEQYRRARHYVNCECTGMCECNDFVDCMGAEHGNKDKPDFAYKFKIREIVKLATSKERYYGHVKLRRNRGLNQYYVQFMGWCKEHSEWYCEDVLSKCEQKREGYVVRKPSRSSKTNNLVNDPLIREKHSHTRTEGEFERDERKYGEMMYDEGHRVYGGEGRYDKSYEDRKYEKPYEDRKYEKQYEDRKYDKQYEDRKYDKQYEDRKYSPSYVDRTNTDTYIPNKYFLSSIDKKVIEMRNTIQRNLERNQIEVNNLESDIKNKLERDIRNCVQKGMENEMRVMKGGMLGEFKVKKDVGGALRHRKSSEEEGMKYVDDAVKRSGGDEIRSGEEGRAKYVEDAMWRNGEESRVKYVDEEHAVKHGDEDRMKYGDEYIRRNTEYGTDTDRSEAQHENKDEFVALSACDSEALSVIACAAHKRSDIDFYEHHPTGDRPSAVAKSQRNLGVLFDHEVMKYVQTERTRMVVKGSDREVLKKYYGVHGDECVININNYMVVGYFTELKE